MGDDRVMQPYDFIGLIAAGSSPETQGMTAEDIVRLGHSKMWAVDSKEEYPSPATAAYLRYVQSHYPDICRNN